MSQVYDTAGLKKQPAAGGGAITNINVSAGTTSNNLSAVTFSDGSGVLWGLNGSVITASVATNYLTTAMASNRGTDFVQAAAVFNGTNNTGTIASNAISVSGLNQAFSASGGSSSFQTLIFTNSNGVTWTNTAGSVAITHDLQYTSATSAITNAALHTSASRVFNVVAATNSTGGGTASLSSNVSFSAANGLTFYTSAGNAIVGSHNAITTGRASTDAIGLNTAKTNVTWTVNSSGLSLDAGGYLTTAMASNAATISNINVSGGTTSNLLSKITFADSNGVSWGLNASTLTASVQTNYLTTAMLSNAATISNINVSAGTTSNLLSKVTFSDSNGISFGLNASTITASHNAITTGALSNHSHGVSFTSGSVGFQTLSFTNSNGISFNSGTQGIFGSHNAITTGRASTDAVGLNTAQTNVTWTVNSSGLSLNAGGYAGTVTGATNCSVTANTAGVSVNVAAGGAVAASFTSGSVTFQTLSFTNSNGISFNSGTQGVFGSHNAITTGRASTDAIGLNTAQTNVTWTVNSSGLSLNAGGYAGTVSGATNCSVTVNTAGVSVNLPAYLTTAALSNHSHGVSFTSGSTVFQTLSFTNSNGISFNSGTQGIFGSHNAITTGRASTDAIGLNTAQTNVTWTVNSSGLSLNAGGYAGTVTAATNATFTLNSAGLSLSVGAGGGAGFSAGMSTLGNTAGNTGVTGTRLVFVGTNAVSLSQTTDANGGTLSINVATQTNQTGTIYAASNTFGTSSGTYDARTLSIAGDGIISVAASNSGWRISATQSAQTLGIYGSSQTTGSASSGTHDARSVSIIGAGIVSIGNHSTSAGGTTTGIIISATQSNQAFSAQGGSSAFQTLIFTNSNGMSFSNTGGSVWGSYSVPVVSNAIQAVGSATGSGTNTSRFAADDHVHAGVYSAGVSNVGNTAGNTAARPGQWVFAGSNGVTLSQETAANSLQTIHIQGPVSATTISGVTSANVIGTRGSRFALEDHQHVGVYSAGVSTGGNTVGDTAVRPGQVVFAGGANITLSCATAAGSLQTISIVGGAGGGGGAVSFSAGTSSAALSSIVFSNSNNVSFGLNGSTMTASITGPVTLSTYEPIQWAGVSSQVVSLNVAVTDTIGIYPIRIESYVSAGMVQFACQASSISWLSSSARASLGEYFMLYSRGLGASSSRLESLLSNSFSFQISQSGVSVSITQATSTNFAGYTTALTNSNGSAFYTLYTAGAGSAKMVQFPISSLLTPGDYWFCLHQTRSTAGANQGFYLVGYYGAVVFNCGMMLAPFGTNSTVYNAGSDPAGGRWYAGQGMVSTAGGFGSSLPATVAFSAISGNNGGISASCIPMAKFWSS